VISLTYEITTILQQQEKPLPQTQQLMKCAVTVGVAPTTLWSPEEDYP
jgi:hypothetical protein